VSKAFSLTPGFSPVRRWQHGENSFNGFPRAGKPLKRLVHRAVFLTRLKPGVNERSKTITYFFGNPLEQRFRSHLSFQQLKSRLLSD
jgi:hypothetical protein